VFQKLQILFNQKWIFN